MSWDIGSSTWAMMNTSSIRNHVHLMLLSIALNRLKWPWRMLWKQILITGQTLPSASKISKLKVKKETFKQDKVSTSSYTVAMCKFISHSFEHLFSESDSYCYSIINLSSIERTYVIDYSQSEDILGIPSSGAVIRTVQPGDCAYLFSMIANPNAEQYTRKIKVSVRWSY